MEKKGFDQKVASWFRGRNGTDELSTCIIVVAFIVVIANIFLRSLEFIGPVRPWLRNPAKAMGEARAYKHLKCPECGQRVRVPRGKGKIRVRCPQCKTKFDARS